MILWKEVEEEANVIGVDQWYIGMFEYAQPQDAAHRYLRNVRDSDPTTTAFACLKHFGDDYFTVGIAVLSIAQACGANINTLTDVIKKTYDDEMRGLPRWQEGRGIARSILVLEWYDKVTGEAEPYTATDFPRSIADEIRNYSANVTYGSKQ
jgi:hypothetical protein